MNDETARDRARLLSTLAHTLHTDAGYFAQECIRVGVTLQPGGRGYELTETFPAGSSDDEDTETHRITQLGGQLDVALLKILDRAGIEIDPLAIDNAAGQHELELEATR